MTDSSAVLPVAAAETQTEYREQVLSVFRDNPFIEALPPRQSSAEVAKWMKNTVPYSPSYIQLPADDRKDFVMQLSNILQPVAWHIELAQTFYRIIRDGYVARNPTTRRFLAQIAGYGTATASAPAPAASGTTNSYGLIGQSGAGKSRAIRSILGYYPQVIAHTSYKGQPFLWKQLTWLHINCPVDGSLSKLGVDFFRSADEALGTNYLDQFVATRSKERLHIGMAKVAAIQGLGVLVIDHLDNLKIVDKAKRRQFLGFTFELNNSLGIPTVLVGHDGAKETLTEDFDVARRCTGNDATVLGSLTMSEFENICKALWGYRILEEAGPLTADILSLFHALTAANPDILCKLYQAATRRALSKGIKKLSRDLILSVFQDCFPLLHKSLAAAGYGLPAIQLNPATQAMDPGSVAGQTAHSKTLAGAWQGGGPIRPFIAPISEGSSPVAGGANAKSKSTSAAAKAQSRCELISIVRSGAEMGLSAYTALKAANYIYQPPTS